MNTTKYNEAWGNLPVMRPAFVMIKDVDRLSGMITYTKDTKVYGTDCQNTFWSVDGADTGNVSLPLNSVKFIGYVDINHPYEHIINQFDILEK